MGISGLLPLLKSIHKHVHLSELSGKTLAVDAYVWLHRGAYGCAEELVTGRPTIKYVDYAMHRVRMLRHFGIEPFLVFDGGPLPAKLGTEVDRKKRRDDARTAANKLRSQGRLSEARQHYAKCIDITPQHAYQLIKALRAESVRYVVAPYEADAQLTLLERMGIVDGILTEDSDLLVFGCSNVYFKLETENATVVHIAKKDLGSVAGNLFVGWSEKEFRHMAILSGCDYLPSIAGMGLKTAHKLLKKHKTLERALKMLRLEGKMGVSRSYEAEFARAELAFLHQRAYDPVQKKLVHISPPIDEWDHEKEKYVGHHIEDEIAQGIANGELCPVTHQPLDDINPSFRPGKVNTLQTRSTGASTSRQPPSTKGTLHAFFGAATTTPSRSKSGGDSGKRTLSGELEKASRQPEASVQPQVTHVATSSSRFFTAVNDGSLKSKPKAVEVIEIVDGAEDELQPQVEQELRYQSPDWAIPFVSSPVHSVQENEAPVDLEVDPISSPVVHRKVDSSRLSTSNDGPLFTDFMLAPDLEDVFIGSNSSFGSSKVNTSDDTDSSLPKQCGAILIPDSDSEDAPREVIEIPDSDDMDFMEMAKERARVIGEGWNSKFKYGLVNKRSPQLRRQQTNISPMYDRRKPVHSPSRISPRKKKGGRVRKSLPLETISINSQSRAITGICANSVKKRSRHSEPGLLPLQADPDGPPLHTSKKRRISENDMPRVNTLDRFRFSM